MLAHETDKLACKIMAIAALKTHFLKYCNILQAWGGGQNYGHCCIEDTLFKVL